MDNLQQTRLIWLLKLQGAINNLLKPILLTQDERNKYLTPQAMLVWEQAFTHETVSVSKSYEDLEYLGDRMLHAVFAKYLTRRFPHLHKGEFTELNSSYMSKMFQAELSRKMGLGEHIRIAGLNRAILNIEADVFESFFGALDAVSDLITPGTGYANCYNMVIYLFNDVVMDESKGKGSAKTQTIQIFSRFGLGKIEERDDDTGRGINFSVTLKPEHSNFLRQYGVEINNLTIGSASASTKKEAEVEAYKMAFRTLTDKGITSKWAEQVKNRLELEDPSIKPYVSAARIRLEKEGFEGMHFFIPRNSMTPLGAAVQLIGVRKNGEKEILAVTHATDRETGYSSGRVFVINKYASNR